MSRTERVYYADKDQKVTRLLHRDNLGNEVPLLSEAGRPVNFERDPAGLNKALIAMATMDRLYGRNS